ncbi:MAG: hypothetical protein M3O36_01250 [Myxococcota bacterium]|nr:hypothetical protein [Myxococcota bacterium]
MPEGDTIHRAAKRLSRALAGKIVTRCESSIPAIAGARLTGRRVDEVMARGKYLFVRFDDGRVLLSHMRMVGSWHLYKEGERWWLPAHTARVVLAVGPSNGDQALVAVCFAAPLMRLVGERRAQHAVRRLGPDVMTDEFDAKAAVQRLQANGERAIAEALLDQTNLAGVGNIYKSEVLFAERIDPFTTVAALSGAQLTAVVMRAHSLMRSNLAAGRTRRTTTPVESSGRFAVYRRKGRPCPRCGCPIARAVQATRATYYCPRCQVRPG